LNAVLCGNTRTMIVRSKCFLFRQNYQCSACDRQCHAGSDALKKNLEGEEKEDINGRLSGFREKN